MPDGGAITVAARNVEVSAVAAPRGFRDRRRRWGGHARGGPLAGLNVVLQERPGQRPTGLGLHQIQRFAEGRGSAVGIESERCAGTLVRLFLRRTGSWACPAVSSGTEIAHTPSHSDGVFHVVNPATAAPTL
jgi:hypothetical protein